MAEAVLFEARSDFRRWLTQNCATNDGVWLVFGKPGGPQTLRAEEALEEALCFGWIDGQIKSVDDGTYWKYFARRRRGSAWSEKNKKLVAQLEQQGLMTDCGREKIEEARQAGTWDAPPPPKIADEQVEAFAALVRGVEPAYTNLMNMAQSARRNYTGLYFSAKSEETRARRLQQIIDRLNSNLKPMESGK